jgi:hypothetical protein
VPLPPVTFPTLGWQVIDWIEQLLVHGPGDIEGDPIEIDDEIALFICWLYRLHPADHQLAGRRLARRAILSRPKGRAKSEHAGEIVCAEALGPVRFDHWAEAGEVSWWDYEYAKGEPVGRPVRSPFIRCLATEEDQAGNTYDNVVVMLTQGRIADEFGLRMGKEVGLTRTFLPDGGEIRPSTSGDASKDGGLESCSVADETHLYVLPGLRKMYRTVSRNTGKRKDGEPLMLDTTTAWAPGEHSIAEQAAEKYAHLDVEECLTRHGVLYDHRQGEEPKRFNDDRSLIKAIREGYGPAADWMDFRRIVQIIREAEDPEEEAYRYWLNRPRAAASHWLDPAAIAAVLDQFDVEPGSMIGLGFDGSENDDHTVLMGATEDGDLFTIGYWTPEGDDLGWRQEVMSAVDWAYETFQVVRHYGDPPWWQEEMGKWAAKYSDPERPGTLPVAEFWTNVDSKMAIACGALRSAINRGLRSDSNPGGIRINPVPLRTDEEHRAGKTLLQWHFENARKRKIRIKLEDRAEEAHVVRKERPGSPLKIDGVTSSALARRARDDGQKQGEFVKQTYGRASWTGGRRSGRQQKVERDDYLPCRGCGQPIHPRLHEPDAAEHGRCFKCRSKAGGVTSAKW